MMDDKTKSENLPAAPASPHAPAIHSAIPEDELARLTDEIVSALKSVYDPEIPADIYELGLIYKVDIADDHSVAVDMTLTSPNCPAAGVGPVTVKVVFDPPWDQSRMSEEARLALNLW